MERWQIDIDRSRWYEADIKLRGQTRLARRGYVLIRDHRLHLNQYIGRVRAIRSYSYCREIVGLWAASGNRETIERLDANAYAEPRFRRGKETPKVEISEA